MTDQTAFVLQSEHWYFLNEGAANIIFACSESTSQYAGLVMRVNKHEIARVTQPKRVEHSTSRTDLECDRNLRRLVQKLIGTEFCQPVVSIDNQSFCCDDNLYTSLSHSLFVYSD